MLFTDFSRDPMTGNFGKLKNFLYSMSNGFLFGQRSTRIGVVLFNSKPRYVAPMSTYVDRDAFQNRINQLE